MRISGRRSRLEGARSCAVGGARDSLRKSRVRRLAGHAPSRAPLEPTQLGHISLAMSRSHGTSCRPRARNELALLQCGQNLRNAAAPRSRSFLRCADGAVETRQPAVAQPAGCCVSNENGSTWGSRGELRCSLERASQHAHVLSDHVHHASCARVCRSSNQCPNRRRWHMDMAHRACYHHGVESRSRQVLAEASTDVSSDDSRGLSCVRSGGGGDCTCPLLPFADAA